MKKYWCVFRVFLYKIWDSMNFSIKDLRPLLLYFLLYVLIYFFGVPILKLIYENIETIRLILFYFCGGLSILFMSGIILSFVIAIIHNTHKKWKEAKNECWDILQNK